MAEPARDFNPQNLRKTVLDMAYAGSSVHIGCAFSIIEILAVLYRSYLRYPGNNPEAEHRDYFILSKGHGVMAQYACLYQLGWLTDHDIQHYFAEGSRLMGLSDSRIPGLEVTSGSLGHGFSVAVGLALAASLRKTRQKTYVLVGDGEINEGPIWEGALFAAHHQLQDFLVIVDQNDFQAMGSTESILNIGSIAAKFESFGFEVRTINGHDQQAIHDAIKDLHQSPETLPKAIVAKTVKGRGVPFMENDNCWHYQRLNPETYEKAMAALEQPTP